MSQDQNENRIGVDVDDFGVSSKDALKAASDLGFHNVEMGAVSGDVAAWNLSASGRRHLLRFSASLGLRLNSLTADIPGLRFTTASTVDELVDRTLQVLELAADIDVPVVTASIGGSVISDSGEAAPGVVDVLQRIGQYAADRGRAFGIRPSLDSGESLTALVNQVDCPGIKICLDPAAQVMFGVNPLALFDSLADQVVLFHARDASAGTRNRAGAEVNFGEGDVDLRGLFAAMKEAEYRGAYILRRTESRAPASDMTNGRDTLASLLSEQESKRTRL